MKQTVTGGAGGEAGRCRKEGIETEKPRSTEEAGGRRAERGEGVKSEE